MAKPGVEGGDGKQSPFGDGQGGAGMSSAKPNNFLENPAGGGNQGAKPRDPLRIGSEDAQKSAGDGGRNLESIPQGGTMPFTSPMPSKGNPLGSPKPPFKLGG